MNDKIQRYQEIKKMMAELESEMKLIGEEFKEKGSFETDLFSVKISEQSREFLKGIKDVAAVVGREVLDQNGLVGTTTYQTIRISELKAASKSDAA